MNNFGNINFRSPFIHLCTHLYSVFFCIKMTHSFLFNATRSWRAMIISEEKKNNQKFFLDICVLQNIEHDGEWLMKKTFLFGYKIHHGTFFVLLDIKWDFFPPFDLGKQRIYSWIASLLVTLSVKKWPQFMLVLLNLFFKFKCDLNFIFLMD